VVHGDPIPALTSTTSPASSLDHLEDAWAPVQAVVARVVVRLEDAELEKARHRVPVGLVRTPVASLCISYREDRVRDEVVGDLYRQAGARMCGPNDLSDLLSEGEESHDSVVARPRLRGHRLSEELDPRCPLAGMAHGEEMVPVRIGPLLQPG